MDQSFLVALGRKCYHFSKYKAVTKLSPKELSYIGYNAYSVSKLDINVCEICYREVEQKVKETESNAAIWVPQRNEERKHRTLLTD